MAFAEEPLRDRLQLYFLGAVLAVCHPGVKSQPGEPAAAAGRTRHILPAKMGCIPLSHESRVSQRLFFFKLLLSGILSQQ